jgi:hypothetical protein
VTGFGARLLIWVAAPVTCVPFQASGPHNTQSTTPPCHTRQGPRRELLLSIPVSRLSIGAVTPNIFKGLSSPPTRVFGSRYWTDGRPIRYIAA